MLEHNYIQIQARELPSVYPSKTYTDVKYSSDRVVNKGLLFEKFLTDKKYNIRNDFISKNRVIQAISYNKWELTLFATESQSVGLLELVNTLIVTLQDGSIHYANIISINRNDNLSDTRLIAYTVEYYDTNLQNYPLGQQPINNFLESSYLRSEFSPGSFDPDLTVLQNQLNGVRFQSTKTIDSEFTSYGNTYSIFTNLTPDDIVTKPIIKEAQVANLSKVSQVANKKQVSMRFYFNEATKNIVEYYLSKCDTVTGYYLKNNVVNTVVALETVLSDIEPVQGSIDIYRANINLTQKSEPFNKFG
ncbi:MAG: hypothetical protein QNK20_16500 [Aureibaculum sp.]|nr:hypothetical protein [Aureibaculum sp.]